MAFGVAYELPDSPKIDSVNQESTDFTRRFLVEADSYTDGPLGAYNAVGIPRPGTNYVFGTEFHLRSKAREYSAERKEPNSLIWIVEVKYSVKADEDEEDNPQNDPLLESPEITLTTERVEEAILGSYDQSTGGLWGEGLLNSASEPFNPPPVRDVVRQKLEITINRDISFPVAATIENYLNRVNSAAFFGWEAGSVKFQGLSASKQTRKLEFDGETYYQDYLKLTYTFEKRDTWKLKILDAGSYYIDGTDKIYFKTADGQSYIGLLDGAGGDNGDTEVFLTKKIYEEKSFAPLDLPSSFEEAKAFVDGG